MMAQTCAPVVALLDGATDEPALSLAAWEAQARGSSLVVVYCQSTRGDAKSVVDFYHRHCPGLPVDAHPVVGGVVETVRSVAAEGRLLVVGQQTGDRRRIRTSSLLELARDWPGPVLVAPESRHCAAGLTGAPVVVGVSVGSGADHVVEFAMVEAQMRATSLRAMHVRAPVCPGSGRGELPLPAGGYGSAEELLDEALVPWSEKFPEITVDPLVHVGIDPVIALAAASHSAAIVVVGRGAAGTSSLPGTPYALLSRAVCPVAIVRPQAHRQCTRRATGKDSGGYLSPVAERQ
jgi:hypothetical protein